MKELNYLALGDSYTVGEGVALSESFPYQFLQMMRSINVEMNAPEIVAKTGWTSGELIQHIDRIKLKRRYDLVTLLIGVNNQYRNLDIGTYQDEFSKLLGLSLEKVDSADQVIVLSIPDWGVTPFAEKLDSMAIAARIDEFNGVNRDVAASVSACYVDITTGSRMLSAKPGMVTTDGLHPSGTEYQRWAKLIFDYYKKEIL